MMSEYAGRFGLAKVRRGLGEALKRGKSGKQMNGGMKRARGGGAR